jgi:hypothetical protein
MNNFFRGGPGANAKSIFRERQHANPPLEKGGEL